jgi:hypothetical protein
MPIVVLEAKYKNHKSIGAYRAWNLLHFNP